MVTRGKLTDDQMDILEGWINEGPKTFPLLYAITRDGCNATSFHRKCDNQGPTVTVLYNQQGSVYGGYASASWQRNNTWVTTVDSFLFQLSFNGKLTVNKFIVTRVTDSMLCGYNYGPCFGNGDLHTFSNSVNDAGGFFPLNGDMNGFGNSYSKLWLTQNQINNGTMNVTELEVYKVSDGKREKHPWRKTKSWNTQFLDELTEEIVSFKPQEDVKVSNVRILMIGPIGAGKSSFYNTINSIFRGRVTHPARSGSAKESLTTTYTPYTPKVRSGASLNFQFCDTRGLEEAAGISEVEFVHILDGNIPDYYQFGSTALSLKTPGFKLDPSPNDQIYCAVFVLDSTTLDVLSAKLVEKMKSFQNQLDQRGVPLLIILTKIDKLSVNVEKDVSTAFRSRKVAEHVEKASHLFGLPRLNVLPVKNYENEVELDVNISITALLALRQILSFAADFLDNLSERQKDLERKMNKLKLEKSWKE